MISFVSILGKIAHGSYDINCDGHGFVWEADYCAGGCGYWDDFRSINASFYSIRGIDCHPLNFKE